MSKTKSKKSFLNSLLFKLLVAIAIGIFLGNIVSESSVQVISTIKNILSSLINYIVPIIILAFITPAIVSLNESAGQVLSLTLIICYLSSVGAALFAMLSRRAIIPHLNIVNSTEAGRKIPDILFQLDIPSIMPVMTALITAILFGLAVIWTKSETLANLLREFNNMVLEIVNRVIIKILPLYFSITSLPFPQIFLICSFFPHIIPPF